MRVYYGSKYHQYYWNHCHGLSLLFLRIARELGIDLATPKEARHILRLKGIDKVNY